MIYAMVNVEIVNNYIQNEIDEQVSIKNKFESEVRELEEGLEVKNYVNGRVWDAVWRAKYDKEKWIYRIDNTIKRLSRLRKIEDPSSKYDAIISLNESKQRENTYVLDFYYWSKHLLEHEERMREKSS